MPEGPARPLPAASVASTLLGGVTIACGAWLSVPMVPVPMTLQTLAVLVIGGLRGARAGLLSVAVYVFAGALGLPVYAGFTSAPGLEILRMRSGGYVLGFFVGVAVAARSRGSSLWRAIGWMLAAHLTILVLGAARLATFVGVPGAIEHGLTPFVLGAVAKSALGAWIVSRRS